jgi:nucleotide-binding universal stress UspA family protein
VIAQRGRLQALRSRIIMFRNILLATDGSTAAEHAAKLAVCLARVHASHITAVYVVDPYPYLGMGDTNPMGLYAYLLAARKHAACAHGKVMALCADSNPQVPLELRLIENTTAAKGVLETARDEHCDLIVAGSHGHSGFENLVIGSVVARLVQASHVPVLVVK